MNTVEYCQSQSLSAILTILKNILSIIHIIVPILLIISLIIQITKLVANPEDKKKFNKLKNTVLSIIIIFFIPTLVNTVMNMIGSDLEIGRCWNDKPKMQESSQYVDPYEEEKNNSILTDDEYEKGVQKESKEASTNQTTSQSSSISANNYSTLLASMTTPGKDEIKQKASSLGFSEEYIIIVIGTTQREGYSKDPYLYYGWASAMLNQKVSLSTMQGWDPYHSGDANYYSWSNIKEGYNNASSDVLKSVYLAVTNRNTKIIECNGMYSTTPSEYNCIYTSPIYHNISIYERK